MPIYCGSESIAQLLPDYKWTLKFGSDVDMCCSQVKKYIYEILGSGETLSSLRSILVNRLNLFEEIPSRLAEI